MAYRGYYWNNRKMLLIVNFKNTKHLVGFLLFLFLFLWSVFSFSGRVSLPSPLSRAWFVVIYCHQQIILQLGSVKQQACIVTESPIGVWVHLLGSAATKAPLKALFLPKSSARDILFLVHAHGHWQDAVLSGMLARLFSLFLAWFATPQDSLLYDSFV